MTGSISGFRFDPEWRITLFTLVMVPLMLGLGCWQLQRADEKASLAEMFTQRQNARPALLSELRDKPAGSLAYVPVAMTGTFLQDEFLLLDNRILGGQFGYEVLGILKLDQGGAVLVNRGWIAADASRQSLPAVPVVAEEVTITGHVYVAPGKPFLLAEQQLDGTWPKRVQAVEMDKLLPPIKALLGDDVFPYPVRIDAGELGALSVDWQIVNATPEKHQGYAVQWFSMAAVLFAFYMLRSSNLLQLITGPRRSQD